VLALTLYLDNLSREKRNHSHFGRSAIVKNSPFCSDSSDDIFFNAKDNDFKEPFAIFEKKAIKNLWQIGILIFSIIMIPVFWMLFRDQVLALGLGLLVCFSLYKCSDCVANFCIQRVHKDK